jgi:hypothetical protein
MGRRKPRRCANFRAEVDLKFVWTVLISCACAGWPDFARAEGSNGELGFGMLAGRSSTAEEPDRSSAIGGGALFGATNVAMDGAWYVRAFAGGTGLDGGASTHGGGAIGQRWQYGDVAMGLGLIALHDGDRGNALPFPTFHARAGRVDGLHGAIAILDERGPLHGLAGVDIGVGADDGTDFSMGLTYTESADTAVWAEARFALTRRSRVGIHAARGAGGGDDPRSWNSLGLRFHWTFGPE